MLLLRLLLVLMPIAAYAAGPGPIGVFVSIPPQRQFVQRIGGEHVTVQVMVPPGQSPETFAPSPRLLASLADAQLYFQIGVPFEAAWTDAIRSANPQLRIAECCEQLIGPVGEETGHEHHDLHVWSDPVQVRTLAAQIRDELSAIDPAHGGDYENGYRSFVAELDALDTRIREQLSNRRVSWFIVSHAAFGYFAERYDLTQLSLENSGKESGPKSLLGIVRQAREQNIRTVFAISQYRTPVAASLATELDAGVVELDPLAEDYLHNMAYIAERIAEALQ